MDYGDEAISHVYEIVKTLQLRLAGDRVFRIEVVKVEKGTATAHFGVHYYERQELYKGPDGSITTTPMNDARHFYVWVPDNLPWEDQHSPEAALQKALDVLTKQRNNRNVSG